MTGQRTVVDKRCAESGGAPVAADVCRIAGDAPAKRQMAARIQRDYPHWLVMWSAYYAEYWAYPCFRVPRGTVLHAAEPNELVRGMRTVQISAARGRPVTARASGRGLT
jgi:hypothetical protein